MVGSHTLHREEIGLNNSVLDSDGRRVIFIFLTFIYLGDVTCFRFSGHPD